MKLEFSVNDGKEIGLQGSSADKETVNILLLGQLITVRGIHRATIDDPDGIGNFSRNIGGEPIAHLGVYLLGLLRGGILSCPNSPDRLVSNHDIAPIRHII